MQLKLYIIPKEEFERALKEKKEKRERLEKAKSLDFFNLTDLDIDYLLSFVKRPFDHKKGMQFHFIVVEKGDSFVLFDGRNKIVETFTARADESIDRLKERTRLFALEMFKTAKNIQGGFLFDGFKFLENEDGLHTQSFDSKSILNIENSSEKECEICVNPATCKIYLAGIVTICCQECAERENKK